MQTALPGHVIGNEDKGGQSRRQLSVSDGARGQATHPACTADARTVRTSSSHGP